MQDLSVMMEPLRELMRQIGFFAPRVLVALAILLVGWLIAKGFRIGVVKALRAINFHVLTERAGVDNFLQQGGTDKDTTELFGLIGYWLVILAALIVAFNGLGLTQVTDLLTRVVLFLPRVLVALLLVIFGAYFGRFVGNAVKTYFRNIGVTDADLLGRVVQWAVLTFVILLAIDHLDIGGGLIQQTFLILLTGVVIALALAFGLGGKERAARLLERWFPPEEPPR
jgi:hypothetical protein